MRRGEKMYSAHISKYIYKKKGRKEKRGVFVSAFRLFESQSDLFLLRADPSPPFFFRPVCWGWLLGFLDSLLFQVARAYFSSFSLSIHYYYISFFTILNLRLVLPPFRLPSPLPPPQCSHVYFFFP